MSAKELFHVLPPDEALRRLLSHLSQNAVSELVPLEDAYDRVLAESLRAPGPLPSFRRSTMDGFALRAADTFGASESLPAYLRLAGEVLMGRAPEQDVVQGSAVRISTGGMLPVGADAVVMVEQTQEVGSGMIEVLRAVAPGENVIQVGEDVASGDTVLPKGRRLRPQDIGGLAALGIARVPVSRTARVGIIAGGDEVVPADAEPGPGQIRDVNTHTISGLVQRSGHLPVSYGICPDVVELQLEAARRAWGECDVLVLSAGSSVSTRDMTAEVIASLGEPGVLAHGVALRPGKPTILAVAGGKPVFGLPGNPVSCMVTFDLFVAPVLAHLSGLAESPSRTVQARLTKNIASTTGRVDYVQVRLEEREGELWADPVFGKSNLIYTLVRSDGMVRVDLDRGGLSAGDLAPVVLF